MTTPELVGLLGILLAIGLLIWLAYRGFSLLLAAPAVALVAAAFAGEPLLPHWTDAFMAASVASSSSSSRSSCSVPCSAS